MSKQNIKYGTQIISFDLTFSERKTLGIRVHPDSQVEVIAPIGASMNQIEEKVRQKASWILRQQAFFLSYHPLTPPRQYVSGETHLYLGRQYRLKLIQSPNPSVKLIGKYLRVCIPDPENKAAVQSLLEGWYQEKADLHFTSLFTKLCKQAQSFSDKPPYLRYRWLDKRWGSCHQDGQILLNLELVKASKACIEYVMMHELCHLAHLNHSKAFFDLLEQQMPDWQQMKERLERWMK